MTTAKCNANKEPLSVRELVLKSIDEETLDDGFHGNVQVEYDVKAGVIMGGIEKRVTARKISRTE